MENATKAMLTLAAMAFLLIAMGYLATTSRKMLECYAGAAFLGCLCWCVYHFWMGTQGTEEDDELERLRKELAALSLQAQGNSSLPPLPPPVGSWDPATMTTAGSQDQLGALHGFLAGSGWRPTGTQVQPGMAQPPLTARMPTPPQIAATPRLTAQMMECITALIAFLMQVEHSPDLDWLPGFRQ